MYVNVIIRFCTRSLKYSTDVPWPNCGLVAPPVKVVVPDIVSDCASHSLFRAVETVGVVDALNESPAAKEDVGAGDPDVDVDELLEFDLKEESRFWADDFLRMVGRMGWSMEKWDMIPVLLVTTSSSRCCYWHGGR
jgi:hypothetical protein